MRKAKFKVPGQSWSIKEKLDLVNAICSDPRFSHGEVRAAVVMVLYFHNTTSGELFPSREQVSEQACVGKEVVIAATRKLRRLGFLDYADSDGGCQHRNTYILRKQRSENPTVNGRNIRPQESENPTPKESENPTPNYPCKGTSYEKTPGALPLPRKGEASAPVERKEEASKEEAVVLPFGPTTPPEGPFIVSPEERARNMAKLNEAVRKLRGGSAR
jgi:hypothetical protein